MAKPVPKTKLRRQPNILLDATVRRMLARPPQSKSVTGKSKKKAGRLHT